MNRELNEFTRMTGDQKTGKRRTTTRKLVAAGLVLTCLGATSPTFADLTLKLGASGISNWSSEAREGTIGLRQGGGHLSLDVTMADRVMALSPFLDVYHRLASGDRPRNNMSTNMIGGVNLLLFPVPREYDKVTMYFGVGAGVARTKVGPDIGDAEGAADYKIRFMANALMGLEVKVAKRVSLFVEPHYVQATKMLNGVSAHAGLAFHLNRAVAAPQVRQAPPAVHLFGPRVQPAPQPLPVKKEAKVQASSVEALATMQEMIHFQHDGSDLSDSAKAILNDKVTVFRANPAMRIVIVGFTSQPGTAEYNMALGLRRAEVAKAYLVSQGVDPIRIEIATRGEGQLVVEGPGEAADAENRRGQFRLLIADPYLAAPKH